jgi:hypothetical protein
MPGPGMKPAIEPTFNSPPLLRINWSEKRSDSSVRARMLTVIMSS